MKYLLLGGSGFIGSHLALSLARENEVMIAGHQEEFDLGDPNIKYRQMDFVRCKDFTDYVKDVDVIVHMVSTIIPSDDTKNIITEIEENVNPTMTLLENAAKLKKKVVFMSSGGAIYGENDKPNKENDPTDPVCSYGIIKLTIEKYLALYHEYYGLDYRIVRPANPYSEKIYHNKKQGVVPVVAHAVMDGATVEVYGKGQVRDFIHIDDAISGIEAVLKYDGEERVFNIGTGVGHTVEEVISIVEEKLNKKAKIKYVPTRKCDVSKNVLDIDLISRETGWQPQITLEDGVDKIIRAVV